MDAISGDSEPEGLLALNISNRYLDLQPVMAEAAYYFGKRGLVFEHRARPDEFLCNASARAVLMDRSLPLPHSLESGKPLVRRPGFRMWTDDFSNMFGILNQADCILKI